MSDDDDEIYESVPEDPKKDFYDAVGCGVMFFLIAIGISGCDYLEALAKHL